MTRRVYAKGRNGEEITRTAGQQSRRDGNAPILPMDEDREPILARIPIRWVLAILAVMIVVAILDGRGGW